EIEPILGTDRTQIIVLQAVFPVAGQIVIKCDLQAEIAERMSDRGIDQKIVEAAASEKIWRLWLIERLEIRNLPFEIVGAAGVRLALGGSQTLDQGRAGVCRIVDVSKIQSS